MHDRPARMLMVLVSAALCNSLGVLSGCRSDGSGAEGAPEIAVAPSEPLPDLDTLASAHASRTTGLDPLWARLVAKLEAERVEDLRNGNVIQERISEQLEGHLQLEQPDRAAINLGKLGDVYLYLGSDGVRSWVLDLLDNDNRSGVVYPARAGAASFGGFVIAVDASDLAFLLGIEPWPLASGGGLPSINWAPLGDETSNAIAWAVAISFPDPGGIRTVFLDRNTLLPVRTEIVRVIDADGGTITVRATLVGQQRVDVRGSELVGIAPTVPEIVDIISFDADGETAGLRARLWLNNPRARRIRDAAFDFDALIERFGVPEDSIERIGVESERP